MMTKMYNNRQKNFTIKQQEVVRIFLIRIFILVVVIIRILQVPRLISLWLHMLSTIRHDYLHMAKQSFTKIRLREHMNSSHVLSGSVR